MFSLICYALVILLGLQFNFTVLPLLPLAFGIIVEFLHPVRRLVLRQEFVVLRWPNTDLQFILGFRLWCCYFVGLCTQSDSQFMCSFLLVLLIFLAVFIPLQDYAQQFEYHSTKGSEGGSQSPSQLVLISQRLASSRQGRCSASITARIHISYTPLPKQWSKIIQK